MQSPKKSQEMMAKMKDKKGESMFDSMMDKGKMNRKLVEEAMKRKHEMAMKKSK